jgi:outer membrane immunogenic protein
MRTLITLAALAAATAGVPALAQDTAARDGVSFSGPRVEGLVGWDRLQNHGHDSGVNYGVGAGYDMQRGRTVFGVEAEASDSTAKRCEGARTAADPRLCASARRDLYVGGRIGAVVGSRTLIYGEAGYDNSRVKATLNDGTTKIGLGSKNLDGVRLGAGAEYALGSRSYVKAEYRYTNSEDHWSRNQLLGGVGVRF